MTEKISAFAILIFLVLLQWAVPVAYSQVSASGKHMGGTSVVRKEGGNGRILFKMEQVSEAKGNEELNVDYPSYGQAFPMSWTQSRGLQQDVFPAVEWIEVPVKSFDEAGDASWARKLDEVVQGYVKSRGLPGGVQLAAAKDGKLVYSRTFGVADVTDPEARPMSADALLYFGSISKSITSVAVMSLVQEGKLEMDTPVFQVLGGDGPVADERVKNITLRMCLNHTAGLSDGGGMGTGYDDTRSIESTIRTLAQKKLDRDPGSQYEYTNTTFNIVCRIIEKVSGFTYEDYVRARIWQPLGRIGPVVSSMYQQHPGEVPMYAPTRPGQIKPDKSNLYWKYLWGGRKGAQGNKEIGLEGGGGWKGSAADLALLGADLLSGIMGGPCKIGLTPETIKSMVGSKYAYAFPDNNGYYALGFVGIAQNPEMAIPEASGDQWAGQVIQFMHGGSFGSALHVETYAGGVSWAFCLNAPPHFSGLAIDHVAEPDGLKAQLRQVFQDAIFREGIRFNLPGLAEEESESALPMDHFTGLTLDTPLQTSFTTGEAIRLSGILTDTTLNQINFTLTPASDGDPIYLTFDVIDGRFEGNLQLNHGQAGEYGLGLFARNKEDESWVWLGSFSPMKILQGQGEILLPATYFQRLILDKPLSNQLTTGTSVNVSGILTDTSLTLIQFKFSPASDGDPIYLTFDVIDGRFEGNLQLNHGQAGEYGLGLFARNKEDESWVWLGSFSPMKILQGQGEILLPATYFQRLILDKPLSNQLTTGTSVNVSGILTDTTLNQINFNLTLASGGDPIQWFFDVTDGRFDGNLLLNHGQAGEYNLDIWVFNKETESWAWLGSFSPIKILQGQGEILLPVDFFSGIVLDAPLSNELTIDRLLLLEGTVANHIRSFNFELESQGRSRYLQASIEDGRFRLPLRFHANELGPIQLNAYAELVDGGSWRLMAGFLFTAVDPPAPDLQVGVLALSLLPGESVIIPLLNRGARDLELSPPLIEGPYEVLAFPEKIEAGGRAGIEVAYRGNGDQSGVLTVVSNDPLQPEVKVALSGLRPAQRRFDLAHFQAGSDGIISIPWDFSTGHFVAALYSGQMTQIDTGVVHNFSLGGTAPATKPVALSSAINHRDEVEITLRRKERELANRIRTEGWRAAKLVQAAYQVGDKRSFIFEGWSERGVPDETIFATAVAANKRIVAFVQDDLKANDEHFKGVKLLSNDEIQQAIDGFIDDFELITDVFGAPSDTDGDGKVLFLFTHLVSAIPVGGFYQAASVLPIENGGNGNNADMMFMNPHISPSFISHVMAHELQHLINFNQHVIVRSGQGEESWLNEGLSHLSEDLINKRLTCCNSHSVSSYTKAFLSQPGTAGLMGDASFNNAKRGAAYLFVRSLADRFGLDVIRRLTQTGLADRDNIETATGEKFENLLAMWGAQIYVSGNGLVDHPHLNYAVDYLHTSPGRAFPLPTTIQFSLASGPISGTLRPRGVNFVEVRGEGIATIEIETEAAGQVGAIVLPLSGDFIPTLTIPNNFSGVLFDKPLTAMPTTGTSLNVSGTVTDTSLTQIQFNFTPADGDGPSNFTFDVVDGYFNGLLLFNHQQTGEYNLDLYAYNKEPGSSVWLGSFSPVQVIQQDHEECPFIYTAAFCETEALTKGLRIGGEGYDFEGDYGTKGCYAYDSGTYEGIAFFGTGGDAADMEAEAQTTNGQYRVTGPCSEEDTAVIETRTTPVPQAFALMQNYPNPFNSSTVIHFDLPTSDIVDLSIYNIAGQQVATLAQGMRQAGTHVINWNGNDDNEHALASGLYFYRLQSSTQQQTRKLLLLR